MTTGLVLSLLKEIRVSRSGISQTLEFKCARQFLTDRDDCGSDFLLADYLLSYLQWTNLLLATLSLDFIELSVYDQREEIAWNTSVYDLLSTLKVNDLSIFWHGYLISWKYEKLISIN